MEARRRGRAEDGEGAVSTRLGRWASYHGRQARFGDLDHIVVGPGGVFLLDSKNLSGAISVDSHGLTVRQGTSDRNSLTHSKLGHRLKAEAARLNERIEAEVHVRCWVQSVVVVWGDFMQPPTEIDDVVYLGGADVEAWLRNRPQRLSERERKLLHFGMESELIVPRAEPTPTSA